MYLALLKTGFLSVSCSRTYTVELEIYRIGDIFVRIRLKSHVSEIVVTMMKVQYLGSASEAISRLTDAAIDNQFVDLQGPHDVLALVLGHGWDWFST